MHYLIRRVDSLHRPFRYQYLRSGTRRALLRRFRKAVYFAVEGDAVVVAVLHAAHDAAEWQLWQAMHQCRDRETLTEAPSFSGRYVD